MRDQRLLRADELGGGIPMAPEYLEQVRRDYRIDGEPPTHECGIIINLLSHVSALQFELAALKKPVEGVEIAAMINELYLQAKCRVMEGIPFADTIEVRAGILLRRLSADKARMEEALRFYRDEWEWDADHPGCGHEVPGERYQAWQEPSQKLLEDKGAKARAALPKQKETL